MGYGRLPDGRIISYQEYIQTDEWKAVRRRRLLYDGFRCVFCHRFVMFQHETHHISYERLGNEDINDVVTTCQACHRKLHESWSCIEQHTISKIEQAEQPRYKGHWYYHDLTGTAMICYKLLKKDYWFGGTENCCDIKIIKSEIACHTGLLQSDRISVMDVQQFIRNCRCELLIEKEQHNISDDEFFGAHFGEKNGNALRAKATAYYKSRFKPRMLEANKSMCRSDKDINILMDEVRKIGGMNK